MKKFANNKYFKKIIDIQKLKKILGNRPRKNKVILCHGNFDVVHCYYDVLALDATVCSRKETYPHPTASHHQV